MGWSKTGPVSPGVAVISTWSGWASWAGWAAAARAASRALRSRSRFRAAARASRSARAAAFSSSVISLVFFRGPRRRVGAFFLAVSLTVGFFSAWSREGRTCLGLGWTASSSSKSWTPSSSEGALGDFSGLLSFLFPAWLPKRLPKKSCFFFFFSARRRSSSRRPASQKGQYL